MALALCACARVWPESAWWTLDLTGTRLATPVRWELRSRDKMWKGWGKMANWLCQQKCVRVLSWWKRWPHPIQTGVIMCKYGTVFTVEGILWTYYCIIATLSLEVSSLEGIGCGERWVLLIHVNKRNTKQIFTLLMFKGNSILRYPTRFETSICPNRTL